MSIPIKFSADMSDVRRAFDNLKSDAARGVSLGGSPGSPPSVTGGTPTTANILGQKMVITNPAWAAAIAGGGGTAFDPNGWKALNPGGWAAVNASGGGGQAASVLSGGSWAAAVAGTGPGGGGGGGGGPSFSGSFLGRGFGRVVGAGFLVNEALRVGEANRAYGIASTLAGNDQRARLEATLAYRQGIIGSIPLVGRAVDLLEDPSGSREAGIQGTLRGADAIDAKTRLLKSTGLAGERLGYEADLAETRDPVQRRLAQARIEHLERRRQITERGYGLAAADRDVLDAQRATMEADRSDRANRMALSDKSQSYSAAYASAMETLGTKDNAALAQSKTELATKLAKTLEPQYQNEERRYKGETDEDKREYDYQRKIESIRSSGQITALGFAAANNPRAAQLAELVAQGRADIEAAKARRAPLDEQNNISAVARAKIAAFNAGKTREDQYAADDLNARSGATQSLLDHKPLQARLREIDAETNRRFRDPYADRMGIEGLRFREQNFAVQEDRERRGLLRDALAGEGRSLDLILHDKPHAARANDIATRAELEARKLQFSGDDDNANQVLRNAVLQEQALKKAYLESFKPVEVDPTYSAINGPRGGAEDSRDVMQGLKTAIDKLNGFLDQGAIASD